ncbi:sulfate reduction electron transfer complex DsrMKJOP subunit DsrO [Chloroflexota bacterium]
MARWGMVIDLDKCVGCQACTVACKEENNVPHGSPLEQKRRTEMYWHKVIAVSNGKYPTVSIDFIPMPCMHCDDAPCVTVCPAKATYHREDGIVMQNFRRCIGCKYCIIACPYGARNFNYKEPEEEAYHRPDLPPNRSIRGPWPFPHRVHGVVEKCTFCFHRIDQGVEEGKKIGTEVVPACIEACPTKARVFGDLDDPNSEVSQLLSSRQWIRLREGMGTDPKVFYLPK